MRMTIRVFLLLALVCALLSGCSVVEPPVLVPEKTLPAPTLPPPTPTPEPTPEPVVLTEEEGRFMGENGSFQVGSYTITAEWLPFQDCITGHEASEITVAEVGDSLYVLAEGLLRKYSENNGILVLDEEFPEIIPDTDSASYVRLSADDQGMLYLSASAHSFLTLVKDDVPLVTYDYKTMKVNFFQVHPSGGWGISSFVKAEQVAKITVDTQTAKNEPLNLMDTNYSTVVNLSKDHILLYGDSLETEEDAVYVYDLDGNLEMTFGEESAEEGSLRAPRWLLETENGFVVMDMSSLHFYDKSGGFLGSISQYDIFGEGFKWLSSLSLCPNGDILAGFSFVRKDENGKDFGDKNIYRLSGF